MRRVLLPALLLATCDALFLRGHGFRGRAEERSSSSKRGGRCEMAAERMAKMGFKTNDVAEAWEREFSEKLAQADEASLKNTFKELAAKAHPDHGGSMEKFQALELCVLWLLVLLPRLN